MARPAESRCECRVCVALGLLKMPVRKEKHEKGFGDILCRFLYDCFCPKLKINSVQTRCVVKAEAQKSPLSGGFLGVFDFLRIACSLGIPQENLQNFNIKAPCKSTCLYNAPSMHTVEIN